LVSNYVRATSGKDYSDLASFLFAEDQGATVLDLGVLSTFFPKDPRHTGQTAEIAAAADIMPIAQRRTLVFFVQSYSGLISLLNYCSAMPSTGKSPSITLSLSTSGMSRFKMLAPSAASWPRR
jgi:hypothetical protein